MSGVCFADGNLTLAVVARLIRMGLVPPFDTAAWRAAHPSWEDPNRLDADLRAALTHLPLDPAAVASIEVLRWGAWSDAELRHVVWTCWGGEDDTFDIASLAGIGQLERLKDLQLEMCSEGLDLAPLVGHPSLETLALHRPVTNLAPLLSLPRLMRVTVPGIDRLMHASTVAALRAKGVGCHE